MSELLLLGTSHKTAPLALRERIALTETGVETLLAEARAMPDVQEAVALSTCNRTELYMVVGDPVEAESAVVSQLARRAGLRPTQLLEGVYSERNCDAARHLYRVASGLESMVIGEAEVQGQVKRAYELAQAAGTTGAMTNRLFQAALTTGKRVRSETGIAVGRRSVASVAVERAMETFGDLADRHVLIVGAGETSELTAEALHARGVRTLFVANRRRERAEVLAARFNGETLNFDELPDALVRADIVVASTSSPHALIEAEVLSDVLSEREGRPLLLIDLAVPRDVEPACGLLPGVTLTNVDDLRKVLDRNFDARRAEIAGAEAVVEEEIASFASYLGSLEVMPTIAALRRHADAIVAGVLEENETRWEDLTDRDRERVAAVARTVAQRLLHEPTLRVKQSDGGARHARMHVLRELFGLMDEPADEPVRTPR